MSVSIFSPKQKPAKQTACETPVSTTGDVLKAVTAMSPSKGDIQSAAFLDAPRAFPLIVSTDRHNVVISTTAIAAVKASWTMLASKIAVIPSGCDLNADWTTNAPAAGVFTLDLEPSALPTNVNIEAPVLGYLVRVQFTPSDELSTLRVRIGAIDAAEVSGIVDSTSYVTFFVPAISTTSPSLHDGTTVYSNSPDVADYDTLTMTVFSGGSAAGSEGGWRVQTKPVFLTNNNR